MRIRHRFSPDYTNLDERGIVSSTKSLWVNACINNSMDCRSLKQQVCAISTNVKHCCCVIVRCYSEYKILWNQETICKAYANTSVYTSDFVST